MKSDIISAVKAYVVNCYSLDTPAFLVYHNISHTEDVVAYCQEISNNYSITDDESHYLQIAAWFHDIGYLYSPPAAHEEKSVELMRSFLAKDCTLADLSVIDNIILATKTSKSPATLLESIIRDADSYHFGTTQFFVTDRLVRQEMETLAGHSLPNWKEHSLQILKSHQFYTSYCKERLNAGKRENIQILQSQK